MRHWTHFVVTGPIYYPGVQCAPSLLPREFLHVPYMYGHREGIYMYIQYGNYYLYTKAFVILPGPYFSPGYGVANVD